MIVSNTASVEERELSTIIFPVLVGIKILSSTTLGIETTFFKLSIHARVSASFMVSLSNVTLSTVNLFLLYEIVVSVDQA